MPRYTFYNKVTEEEFTINLPSDDLDEYLATNTDLEWRPQSFAVVDPMRMGRIKPPEAFNDRLKEIKKKHRGSNITTWGSTTDKL